MNWDLIIFKSTFGVVYALMVVAGFILVAMAYYAIRDRIDGRRRRRALRRQVQKREEHGDHNDYDF